MVNVEKASLKDVPQIVELVNSAYRGDSSRAGWTTEADLLDGIRTSEKGLTDIIEQGHTILLLREGEQQALIGCVLLEKEPDSAYLGMLTVKPTRQGCGIGKLLLQAGESWAQAHGLSRIRMTVITVRTELIDWYKRHGYEETGEHKPFPMNDPAFGLPKQPLEFLVLEKPIAPKSAH